MTTQDAKTYLAKREIPQLFESLMTGLMYYRPDDHIAYLQECLKKVKEQGIDKVKWNIFIESKKKTPLPPITPENGRNTPITRDRSFITDRPASLEEKRGSPLPPIGQGWQQDDVGFPDRIKLPNCPLVLVMGGPGSGRATQSLNLLGRYKGWVHLSMGDLLRAQIFEKGSADQKWDMIGSLVSKGQLAPEEMPIELVTNAIQKHMDAKGIIIEGFPRTMQQVEDYNKFIGRVDLAFVLDCEEYYMQQRLLARGKVTGRVDDNINAVSSRISFFKDKTLPAIKHYDDLGKLCIVDGDRDSQEIFYDLATLFDSVFYPGQGGQAGPAGIAPRPPTSPKQGAARPTSTKYSRPGSRTRDSRAGSRPGSRTGSRPGSGFSNVPVELTLSVNDTGRKAGMPTCPIFIVMGGPGSGRNTVCQKVAESLCLSHISMGDVLRKEIMDHGTRDEKIEMISKLMLEGNMAPEDVTTELLKKTMQSVGSKAEKAILLEGYPRTKEQLEQFNQCIGGLSGVVLIDCEETTLRKALNGRVGSSSRADDNPNAFDKRISFFKHNSLPILGHFDDMCKLTVVNGDRDSNAIYTDVCSTIRECLSDCGSAGGNKPMFNSGFIPPIEVDNADCGRVSGLPDVALISIVGSPGSGLENCIKKAADGLSCPCIVANNANDVISCLKSNSSAKVILVQNFPTNKAQVEDFNKTVGGLRHVIVLDCDENHAKSNAGSAACDIDTYKCETLPVLGYYDDKGKLCLIDTQKVSDVPAAICTHVNDILNKPELPVYQPSNDAVSSSCIQDITLSVYDTGRLADLPTTPIIAILGAPACGTEAHCKAAAEKHSALLLQNHNVDGVLSSLKSNTDKSLIIIECLPKNKEELEQFNSKIGGMLGVVVVDTPEELSKSNGADNEALNQYKANTLPVLAHYEDNQRLEIVKGEESNVTENVCKAIENLLNKKQR